MAVEEIPSALLTPEFAAAGGIAGILALGAVVVAALVVFFLAAYIYGSITMMLTANRLKTKDSWLAWIPIANLVLLSRMAKMPWWPVLLLIGTLIPGMGGLFGLAFYVFQIIWMFKVCEARKMPGWFAILTVIPVVGWIWGYVLWGLLAWGK